MWLVRAKLNFVPTAGNSPVVTPCQATTSASVLTIIADPFVNTLKNFVNRLHFFLIECNCC